MKLIARTALIALLLALGLLVSCGDDDNGNGSGANDHTTVNVILREFSVDTDLASVRRGTVTFHVINAGDDHHEFLVIKTDLAPDQLPTEDDGSYEEDGPGTNLLDEIESISPGGDEDLEIDLDRGNYVLICNMVHIEENGEREVHYALGMRTDFHVN